jgi:hypothetical protein
LADRLLSARGTERKARQTNESDVQIRAENNKILDVLRNTKRHRAQVEDRPFEVPCMEGPRKPRLNQPWANLVNHLLVGHRRENLGLISRASFRNEALLFTFELRLILRRIPFIHVATSEGFHFV